MGKEQCETSPGQALDFKFLKVEGLGGVVRLHIDRPSRMNTLSVETLRELVEFFESLLYRRDVKVVVVTSAGDKVFVAGADIRELDGFDHWDALWFCDLGHRLFNTMEKVPQTIVAAVDGYCMGGGFDFSMACDLRIASENAKFAHTACKMGIITGFGGTQRLRRLVGVNKAKELFFTAAVIDACEAYEMGIVHEVLPAADFHQNVMEIAFRLASVSWGQLASVKALLNRAPDMDRSAFLTYEIYTTLVRCGLWD